MRMGASSSLCVPGQFFRGIGVSPDAGIPADQPIGDFIRHCQDLASLGIDHAIVLSAGPWTTQAVRSLAPVAAAVRDN